MSQALIYIVYALSIPFIVWVSLKLINNENELVFDSKYYYKFKSRRIHILYLILSTTYLYPPLILLSISNINLSTATYFAIITYHICSYLIAVTDFKYKEFPKICLDLLYLSKLAETLLFYISKTKPNVISKNLPINIDSISYILSPNAIVGQEFFISLVYFLLIYLAVRRIEYYKNVECIGNGDLPLLFILTLYLTGTNYLIMLFTSSTLTALLLLYRTQKDTNKQVPFTPAILFTSFILIYLQHFNILF